VVSGWQGDLAHARICDDQCSSREKRRRLAHYRSHLCATDRYAGGCDHGCAECSGFLALTINGRSRLIPRRPPSNGGATREGAAVKIPDSDWAFADCNGAAFPGKPDPAKVCLKSGFDPAKNTTSPTLQRIPWCWASAMLRRAT